MLSLAFGALALFAPGAQADVPADLVTQIPGFPVAPFKIYSGYLNVPGPINGYSSLSIHYELHLSQNDPSTDPLVTWHQGGPGGNSLYGAYGEMGYFQLDRNTTFVNEFAWNRVANMLYLESPAGSDDPIGFSTCSKNGQIAATCSWDDKTQAEAYGHTLQAFYKAYPELKANDLFLSGESYAGQYIPNIATYILGNMKDLPLKGIAVGNGCWGGTANSVVCNGENSEANDVDMFYGKGLFSKKLYTEITSTCKFPARSPQCETLLNAMDKAVGPHNIYDIYDNCDQTTEWLERSGKSMRWLRQYLRDAMNTGGIRAQHKEELLGLSGGYNWSCDALDEMGTFFMRADVQQALHLGKPNQCRFQYDTSGPASITLYPDLVKQIRVLIYNGDSDACVPYKGNEEWTTGLADQGVLKENQVWHPWFVGAKRNMPAGYSTTYTVPGAATDLQFVTIRLAGHMVPAFQPEAAYTFFSTWVSGGSL